MATLKRVSEILADISLSYPGRFGIEKRMSQVWHRRLRDIDDDILATAVEDLCATQKWAPSIAEVRERALDLQAGELAPVGPYEAWERVVKSLHDSVSLTDLEKSALNQIGGPWMIQHGDGYTINHFVKAYEALLTKQRRLRTVLPQVAATAQSNLPALPAPFDEGIPSLEESHTTEPQSVSDLLDASGWRR